MTYPTLARRRALATVLCAAVALAGAAFRSSAPDSSIRPDHDARSATRLIGTLEFTAQFDGVGAEGVDMVWKGPVSGTTGGEVTVRLRHLGAEGDRAKPTWPVQALVFVAMDDASKSFIAEMGGSMDWRTGEMLLSGEVTNGWRRHEAASSSG